jgi:Domain of unknown function (DUF4062)
MDKNQPKKRAGVVGTKNGIAAVTADNGAATAAEGHSIVTRKIRVMISSRCEDPVVFEDKVQKMSDLRQELAKQIEAEMLFGRPTFDVWINENQGSGNTVWEDCLKEVRAADILLVLYNGNSGWPGPGNQSNLGICHAELQEAWATAPDKVRLIGLPMQPLNGGPDDDLHSRFRDYVTDYQPRINMIPEGGDIIKACRDELYQAVLHMVKLGGREATRGKFYAGEPLEWSQHNFLERQALMVEALRKALLDRDYAREEGGHIFVTFNRRSVLLQCHAVPAAMGISAAREMIGQPFLRDHECVDVLKRAHVGPIHVIACQRTVSESQAIKLLGFPDAVIVSPPFGVYVADNVQKIQLAFISNCRDETTTRNGVQRFFNWLKQSREETQLAERAAARKHIVLAIVSASRVGRRTVGRARKKRGGP